ncbi:hypothetical protein AAA081_06500 [Aedoeadaptatus acetigenes]|uniref:YfjL-like N-terminal domain-containing protein n=1 Tax=Aedoeadaptatus acetigenes TaxID=2981723 RepID=A0ABV1J6W0_9FIRM
MKNYVDKIAFAILFAIVLVVLNALYGNPVSKAVVERGADKVIAEKYGDLDLSREKVFYNFKAPEYVVYLQDKNSEDSAFELCFDSFGRLQRDTYEERIDNTVMRFDDAIRDHGRGLEKAYDFPYQITLSFWDKVDPRDYLTVDQPVDMKHLPFKLQAQIKGVGDEVAAKAAMAVLQRAQGIMDEEGLNVTAYTVDLTSENRVNEKGEAQKPKDEFFAMDIPQTVVREGDVKALEELAQKQMTEGKD